MLWAFSLNSKLTQIFQNLLVLLSSCVGVEVLLVIFCVQTSGWSPLFFACKEGSMEMARLLLTGGADVQLQDKVRKTSTILDFVDISILSFLCISQNGVTAYDIAKLHGKDELCDLLQNYRNTKEKEITEVRCCNI